MARKVTKKGALQVSQTLDRLASLFEKDFEAMGISQRVASDFALRLDHTSDLIEKSAGIKRAEWDEFGHGMAAQPSLPETDGFDPTEIAKTEPGALETDPDEPYVRDNFTEQETNELSDKQLTGQLPYADVLPEQDMLGKLAGAAEALTQLTQQFLARKAGILGLDVRTDNLRNLFQDLSREGMHSVSLGVLADGMGMSAPQMWKQLQREGFSWRGRRGQPRANAQVFFVPGKAPEEIPNDFSGATTTLVIERVR